MASLRNNPVSNFILGPGGPPNQPGVGGVRDSSHPLQQDPVSGMWFDPQTGTSYYDSNGTQVVTDPNIAQQVATNFQRAQGFLNNIAPYNAVQQQVLGQQGDLASHFQNVINGNGGSLAGLQLQQGMNDIGATQMSAVSGTSGAGAPLAQLAAMRNTGSAQIAANNAAAMARVKEEQDAANALSTLLSQRAAGAAAGVNQNIGAGENFANQADIGQTTQQGADAAAAAARAASAEKLGYSLSGGAGAGLGQQITGSKDKQTDANAGSDTAPSSSIAAL